MPEGKRITFRLPDTHRPGALPTNTAENGVAGSRADGNKSNELSFPRSKYRHVEAVHSTPRNSCLSHDSNISPSFLGFRNLMVLVVSKLFFNNQIFECLF